MVGADVIIVMSLFELVCFRLCMVRLASLGKDGRVLRNALVNTLWMDLETRSKQLGVSVETLLAFG
jgi:hypothetical protein